MGNAVRSLLTISVALLVAMPVAQAQDASKADPNDSIYIARDGWVDYERCTKVCAALGMPYQYNLYFTEDLARAIELAIQDLGFSLLPPANLAAASPKCSNDPAKEPSKRNPERVFSTDFINLSPELLKKFATSRGALRIDLDERIVYQLQLAGCYFILSDGVMTAQTQPELALREDLQRNGATPYRTTIQLSVAAHMRKRGSLGAFVPVREDIDSKPLLDAIRGFVQARAEGVKPRSMHSTNAGEIVY